MAEAEQRTSPNPAVNAAELRKRRQILGLSMVDLSKRCGLSQGYLSLIENGTRPTVSPGAYGRICDALNISDRTVLMAGASQQSAGARSSE